MSSIETPLFYRPRFFFVNGSGHLVMEILSLKNATSDYYTKRWVIANCLLLAIVYENLILNLIKACHLKVFFLFKVNSSLEFFSVRVCDLIFYTN